MNRVSIVLCCYNQAEYVKDAIESVLNQTYQELELIAIDNGSTDRSKEVIRSYQKDPRVRLILHERNESINKRMNEGISRTTGDYISILYADDYYMPNKIQRQIDCFDKLTEEYGVVYSPGYIENVESGERWVDKSLRCSGYVLERMLTRYFDEGYINPISPLVKRRLFVENPYYEEIFTEGEGIYMRFALLTKFHFDESPQVVMRERMNNAGKVIKSNMNATLYCLDRLARHPSFPASLSWALDNYRSMLLRNRGWMAIRVAEDRRWAMECFMQAIHLRRRYLFDLKVLVGILLSLSPQWAISLINRAAYAIWPRKEFVKYKEDYQ